MRESVFYRIWRANNKYSNSKVLNTKTDFFVERIVFSFLRRLGASESFRKETLLRKDIIKSIYIDPRIFAP